MNVIFVMLHLAALMFGGFFLFITIPLHVIVCCIKPKEFKKPRKQYNNFGEEVDPNDYK